MVGDDTLYSAIILTRIAHVCTIGMKKSTSATRILRNRIVLIFDFDGTLGPSTTETFFDAHDLDHKTFYDEVNRRQEEDDWQYALAKAELLREWSHRDGSPITQENMQQMGREYPLFGGADTLVERLRRHAAEKDKEVELEFVLLTAGFGVIPNATVIAEQFDRVYAGELIFDDEGKVKGAKRIITHVDKVHYIKQLQEGLDLDRPSDLENTYLDHDSDNDYVPMSQVVYVGDGASDMSAFQVVESGGGIAIAIDPDGGGVHDWEGYQHMSPERRVHNVAQADYSDDAELYRSLVLAIDRNIAEIQLLRLGEGE